MTTLYYTGIGSRSAPPWALSLAKKIGYKLAAKGYTLRSGAAEGMDTMFEEGVLDYAKEHRSNPKMDIYLPWKGFMRRYGDRYFPVPEAYIKHALEELHAISVCTYVHKLGNTVRNLFGRNFFQVVGYEGIESSFVIYYAKENDKGIVSGGTRIAVYHARTLGIPTFNLYIKDDRTALNAFIKNYI